MRFMCHLVPLSSLLFMGPLASGCYLGHGRGAPGPGTDGGTSLPADAGTPFFDASSPRRDAGAPFDGSLPECPASAFGFACTDTGTGFVLPDRATDLPIFLGDLDACYCGESFVCDGRIDGPNQLALDTAICSEFLCDACMPYIQGTCALPPLSRGTWHVTINGEDAFDLDVSDATPGVGPADRCTRVAGPEFSCGNEWSPTPESVDEICFPREMPIGLPTPIEMTDFCLRCGDSWGPCTVLVTANEIQVQPTSLPARCDVDCPGGCAPEETTCFIPPLEAGEYTVRVGGIPGFATLTVRDGDPSPGLSCLSRGED